MHRNHTQRPRRQRRLPLRLHLILWSSGLVLALSLALVFFINIVVAQSFPHIISQSLPGLCKPTTATACQRATAPATIMVNPLAFQELLKTNLTHKLWMISLSGLGLIALLGCAGSYWLVGRAIGPLRDVSQATTRVHAQTLDTRLTFAGPDDEIKHLADAFDTMLERLEQAFTLQGRFIGDVSHELRTPLALLRTNLEVAAAQPEASLQQILTTQEQAITRLEHLVADLLTLARCEQPATLQTIVSLEPLLEDTLDELIPVAAARHVHVSLACQDDMLVRTIDDGVLLAQAFQNIIKNAIHYNQAGGHVVVSLEQEAPWACVTITDTGIGMTAEQVAHIFERFYRVDGSRTRHTEGTGLGLAIATTIVEQHSGRICVTSTPHVGSTFKILLPMCSDPIS